MQTGNLRFINLTPPQVLIFIFLTLITVGTLLLKLPVSTTIDISWLNALFTATSAMTVTGLIVVDTGQTFTLFGELVILTLIQLGGLGIMTFAVLIFLMLGKKVTVKERLLLQQALNQTSVGGVINLIKTILIYSLTIELAGVILLAINWVPDMGWQEGLYASLFHSISAFNNAGFSIWSDSLMAFVGDPAVNIVITLLFIIGGIGFTVMTDILQKRKFKRLALYSKIMIMGTLALNAFAIIVILLLETHNPLTLGSLSLNEQLWASYFQGVAPRTAGFNTLNIGDLRLDTLFFMLFLMFIGAGSTSTGGGIKLTTAVVILFAVITFLKGKSDTVIFSRTITHQVILKALAISIMSIVLVFMAIFVLVLTGEFSFIATIFEAVSAFGTVGLSMGITADLSAAGQLVIMLLMFVGKLGPLTLAFSIAQPSSPGNIQYPDEDIVVG